MSPTDPRHHHAAIVREFSGFLFSGTAPNRCYSWNQNFPNRPAA